ncbi:TMEM175 family protein, partial [Furfurilactobacillus rossiae]
MDKDRLAAFTDAVLAIVMTILVLELKKPASVTPCYCPLRVDR